MKHVMTAGVLWAISGAALGADLLVPSQFATIQAAINAAAPGDRILIAPGTYNEALNLAGKPLTLESTAGPAVTILTTAGTARILFGDVSAGEVRLVGLTFQNGSAPDFGGGAWITAPDGLVVENCTFTGCLVEFGGGGALRVDGTPTVVTGSAFVGNQSLLNDVGGGGGISSNGSSLLVTGTLFSNNFTENVGGAGIEKVDGSLEVSSGVFNANTSAAGGGVGISISGAATALVEDSQFTNNTADGNSGAGIDVSGEDASLTVRRSTFTGNTVTGGSGAGVSISFRATGLIEDSTFTDNTSDGGSGAGVGIDLATGTIVRCTFTNNLTPGGSGCGVSVTGTTLAPASARIDACTFTGGLAAGGSGGGIIVSRGSATITNVLMTENTASSGAAILVDFTSNVTVSNATIVGNNLGAAVLATRTSTLNVHNSIVRDNDFRNILGATGTFVTVRYSNIGGTGFAGTGNINADPLFVGAGDYRLRSGSPSVDAGSNALVPSGVALDLDGLARFFDDALTSDTGVGTPPIVDMGAYELRTCPADISGDGTADLVDFFEFFGCYDVGDPCADIDGIPGVDLGDFFVFFASFDVGC